MSEPLPRAADPRPPVTAARRSWVFRRRGAIWLVCVVPAAVLALLSEPCVRPGSPVDLVLAALGWAAFVAGAGLRFWATLYVGGRKRKALVVEGPYSVCRNPLYLGSLLVAGSAAFLLPSLLLLVGVGLAALAGAYGTIPAEERDLLEIHAAAFEAYRQRVPRIWPRPSLHHAPDSLDVRLHGLVLEARRFVLWGWLPFAVRALALLREQPWWPHLLRLP